MPPSTKSNTMRVNGAGVNMATKLRMAAHKKMLMDGCFARYVWRLS
jgi:hypothetical protein